MQITKYTHACVRLEDAGRVLVIDPGEWSEPDALLGADAVLVTHEHSDHIETARLAEAGISVFAPTGADITGLDVTLYHPGDALSVPDQAIETLFVPAQGSWLKLVEAIDFVRAVKPRRTYPIHDAGLSVYGLASVNAWFGRVTDNGYRWLSPGETA
jgi:L-ascorbate metabolism protein UlaG (beta-lactamase superfamily)